MKKILIIISSLIIMSFTSSDKPAYKLFDSSGKEISFSKMIKQIENTDIILFGELHNNSLCHWLELEVLKELQTSGKKIIVGMEMFELDNQLILDEYFSGLISKKSFESEMRLWDNYKTDYRPIVEYSKENNIQLIATNIPRRYASFVYNQSLKNLSKLSKEAFQYFAPLPIKYDTILTCYKNMEQNSMHTSGESFLVEAQVIKDATMANSILKNYKQGNVFIHYNGAYHSDNHESIEWFLRQENENIRIMTISTVEQKSVDKLEKENIDIADFIIAVPESMTSSF